MKKPIDPRELQYYFQAQERDTLDREGRSRRSSEVLNIRDRLLALPEADFISVMQTIKSLLSSNVQGEDSDVQKSKKKDATELYDRARSDKITPLKIGNV